MKRLLLAASVGVLACASALSAAADPATDAAPATAPAASQAAAPQTLAAQGNIVSTLQASGDFTILLQALAATNLTAVLQGAGPITLVAPTDEAFRALPPDQLASLMKPENASQLQSLLAYHLINTAVPLSKIQGTRGPVQTVNGAKLEIDASASPIKLGDADVTATSAPTNGDIYVVDKVLSPNAPMASAGPTGAAAPIGTPAQAQQLAAQSAPTQPSADQASAVNPPNMAAAQPAGSQPNAQMADQSAAPAAPSASESGAPTSATVAGDQTTVGMQPVPDTPANRARFGQPLSHAGRHTAASGD